jgi:hypothetical protein
VFGFVVKNYRSIRSPQKLVAEFIRALITHTMFNYEKDERH